MRNLSLSWKIMNDPGEPEFDRLDSEADVREHALIGMYPVGLNKARVLGACHRVRRDLGATIGPQQVRLTDKELYFMIEVLEEVDLKKSEESVCGNVLNKLRHREKTMRNARNRDRRLD